MSVDTKTTPYFDDYDGDKNYQKVLFKPQFPVQARELNQMQTLVQKQIERLGNKVLKQGTVVSGCETVTTPNLAFAKLKNNESNGTVVDVSRYKGKFVKNAANTVAKIVAVESGYVDQTPDLNTIYLRYVTSGTSGETHVFAADEILTVFDNTSPIDHVNVVDGSAGFSNGDVVNFLSAVKVANTAGGNTFSSGIFVGDVISGAGGANVAIAGIEYSGSDTIVRLAPQLSDQLASNTAAWAIDEGTTFINANTAQTLVVSEIIGEGAAGSIAANAIGQVTNVVLTSGGEGYTTLPHAFITSTSASSSQVQASSLQPENFTAKVPVATSLHGPIGVGFGLAVNRGMVYQGGYITRVDPQFIVVEKYNSQPSNKAVGFETVEEIVTALDDSTLYDNALGSTNYTAPGADRLKVTARVIVLSSDEATAREEFLPLVEFSEGEPFRVAEQTESSLLDEHLAVRTFEENGNFVVDPFLLTTKSSAIANGDQTVKIVVDPGVAYIHGHRVATQRNFAQEVAKATTTKTVEDTVSSASYGNYALGTIRGQFVYGEQVDLITDSTVIGTARVKGFKAVEGSVGTYRIYLFDIAMNSGFSFSNTHRALGSSFSVTFEHVNDKTTLYSPNNSKLVFPAPVSGVQSVDQLTYTYQKHLWGSPSANTSGFVTLVLGDSAEHFPIAGSEDPDNKHQLFVATTANVVSSSSLTGTINTTSGNTRVVGTTTTFISSLAAGNYVEVSNGSAQEIVQVASIANNTAFDTVTAPTITLAAGTIKKAFVKDNHIIPSAVTVAGDRKTMTVNLGAAIPSTGVYVCTNVTRTPTVSSKTVARNAVARVNLATHTDGINGPWALGHCDIIRLKGVYKGSNTTFTAAQGTDVTNSFYIDANHSLDSKGTGYLYRKNTTGLSLTSSDRLLAVFDVLQQSSDEVSVINSYPIDDDVALASLTANVNTMELPEIFGGTYIDVRDAFDFRPGYANTIAVHTTQSSAPVNPTEPAYADRYDTFGSAPAPDTDIVTTMSYYLPRRDRVVATSTGDIKVITGQPGTGVLPEEPTKALTINVLDIPVYPSLPVNLSSEMAEIVNLRTANENMAGRRQARFTINSTLTASQISDEQPKRFTQKDIGGLERRLGAVEYYLSLTAAESQAAARFIGSSATNANRFKFGLFVDSFADDSRSELSHPQYNASLDQGAVTSHFDRIAISVSAVDVDSGSNGLVSLPYSSQRLVSQLLATDGPVVPPVVTPQVPVDEPEPDQITPPPAPVFVDEVVQKQCNVLVQNQNFAVSITGSVQETKELRFSSLPGKAELYFNFRDNDNAIEIFQGSTPNFSTTGKVPIKTGLAALALSASDKTLKAYGMGKLETLDSSPQYLGSPSKPSREDAGKILWNHEPANGEYYKIVITKYRKSGGANNWKGRFYYRVFYPCDTVTRRVEEEFNGVNTFNGTLFVTPNAFVIDYQPTTNHSTPVVPSQQFRLTASGIKPLTTYTVLIDGESYTARSTPVGGVSGDALLSTAEGTLTFDLFYGLNNTSLQTLGNKEVVVESADQTSIARATIFAPAQPTAFSRSVDIGGGFRSEGRDTQQF